MRGRVVRPGLSDIADERLRQALVLLEAAGQEVVPKLCGGGAGLFAPVSQEKRGGPGKEWGREKGRAASAGRDTLRKTQRVDYKVLEGFVVGVTQVGDLSAADTLVQRERGRGRGSRACPYLPVGRVKCSKGGVWECELRETLKEPRTVRVRSDGATQDGDQLVRWRAQERLPSLAPVKGLCGEKAHMVLLAIEAKDGCGLGEAWLVNGVYVADVGVTTDGGAPAADQGTKQGDGSANANCHRGKHPGARYQKPNPDTCRDLEIIKPGFQGFSEGIKDGPERD
ncbi:hypothetical protein NDU88_003147 [Pleurodeles waltl]|uniref:Uncharacterized protein n=1 Tax=Pleurodeles waltl TaxID=8319 RepID=A0AAV7W1L4_PLEWA|nr:hypothetical protein NDU88_003147 [Pleurodeles waltl]